MGVLETFTFLYRSNAKEVQKDNAELSKQLDDTQKHANETNESTKQLGLTFTDLAAAALSAWGAVSVFSKIKNEATGIFDYNLSIEKLTRLTNENGASIKAWDGLVEQAGGTAGEFSQYLAKTASEFQAAGIGDRITNIIPALRGFSGEIKNVDMQTALTMGHLRGIPDDLVLALKPGPEAVDALLAKMQDLNSGSQTTSKAARDFAQAWGQSLKGIGGAWTDLEDIALPFLTKLLNILNQPLEIPDWLAAFIPGFFLKKVDAPVLRHSAAYGGPAVPSPIGNEESRQFWAAQGYTPAQVAGLLANEQRESTFNPNAVGDGGQARGIFQWHADRRAAILAGTGIDVSSASHADQLRAANWELQQRGDDVRLRSATTPQDAASIISRNFERPAAADQEALIRSQLAVSQMQLNAADNTALNSAAVGNSTKSIHIDTINIQTNAPDADGIARAIHGSLIDHYQYATNSYDDGVAK